MILIRGRESGWNVTYCAVSRVSWNRSEGWLTDGKDCSADCGTYSKSPGDTLVCAHFKSALHHSLPSRIACFRGLVPVAVIAVRFGQLIKIPDGDAAFPLNVASYKIAVGFDFSGDLLRLLCLQGGACDEQCPKRKSSKDMSTCHRNPLPEWSLKAFARRMYPTTVRVSRWPD